MHVYDLQPWDIKNKTEQAFTRASDGLHFHRKCQAATGLPAQNKKSAINLKIQIRNYIAFSNPSRPNHKFLSRLGVAGSTTNIDVIFFTDMSHDTCHHITSFSNYWTPKSPKRTAHTYHCLKYEIHILSDKVRTTFRDWSPCLILGLLYTVLYDNN